MWPFNIKKKGKRSIDENHRPDLFQLIERGHIHELEDNNAELRVWLPELCKQALDETITVTSTTGSRYLRELFVVYLYGEHELLRMREQDTGIYYDPPPAPPSEVSSSQVRFSRSPNVEVVPGLGKNIVAIKLFLPSIVKDDLQTMADKNNIPLSTFIREILISHFLGHTLWQERLRSWSPEEEMTGIQWEEGITESQYIGLVDGSRVDGALESNPKVFNYRNI